MSNLSFENIKFPTSIAAFQKLEGNDRLATGIAYGKCEILNKMEGNF